MDTQGPLTGFEQICEKRFNFERVVVSSQIAQELPLNDFMYWRRTLDAPESRREKAGRYQRYLEMRLGTGPTSLTFAEEWARARQ